MLQEKQVNQCLNPHVLLHVIELIVAKCLGPQPVFFLWAFFDVQLCCDSTSLLTNVENSPVLLNWYKLKLLSCNSGAPLQTIYEQCLQFNSWNTITSQHNPDHSLFHNQHYLM